MDSSNKLANWICWGILTAFLLFMATAYLSELFFRMNYSHPMVSAMAKSAINTKPEPIQKDYQKERTMKVKGNNGKPYILKAQADYSISGLVVTENSNFGFRNLSRTPFDGIALMDLGLVWGDLADKKMLKKYFKFRSYKLQSGARRISWRWRGDVPFGSGYIDSHISHNHIVPANKNVASALLKIKKGDLVKLDGYLVDLYEGNGAKIFLTSMSRDDTDSTSRDGGSCENIYVQSVQIGNKIYK